MDYFEQIVARLLEAKGYWVRRSVRVDLTKQDKRDLGKPSLPRPEVDLVAYSPCANELLLLEVKSYLDSPGVKYDALQVTAPGEGRLKLLTDGAYQKLLGERIRAEYVSRRLVLPNPSVRVGLAAGNVPRGDREKVTLLMRERGWLYIDPDEISMYVRSRRNHTRTIPLRLPRS